MSEREHRPVTASPSAGGGEGLSHHGFAHRVRVAVGIALAALAVVLLVVEAVRVVLLAFAAVLVAVLLHTLTRLVERRTGLSHGLSLALVVVLLVAALAGLGWAVAPQLAEQSSQLAEQLPRSFERLQQWLADYAWGERLLAQVPEMGSLSSSGFLSGATGIASSTLGAIADLVIILFAGLYLAAEPRLYAGGFLRLLPPARRERAGEVLHEMGETLKWWLAGQFSSMLVIGVLTAIGLWALGVPLALVLALIAALFEFIPYVGPVLAAVPAILLALAVSPQQALWVALLYLGIQTLESYLVTPLIQRKAVRLPPTLLVFSQVLMGVLTGFLGLALATPLLAAVIVLVQMLYVEDVLGDRLERIGAGR